VKRLKKISIDNPVAAIRARDFLAHHGGSGTEAVSEGASKGSRSGWWELSAADGYKLRCDWRRIADEEQLTFSEIAPASER
jgi:hypothetical protein